MHKAGEIFAGGGVQHLIRNDLFGLFDIIAFERGFCFRIHMSEPCLLRVGRIDVVRMVGLAGKHFGDVFEIAEAVKTGTGHDIRTFAVFVPGGNDKRFGFPAVKARQIVVFNVFEHLFVVFE